jgi:hypothetical protein
VSGSLSGAQSILEVQPPPAGGGEGFTAGGGGGEGEGVGPTLGGGGDAGCDPGGGGGDGMTTDGGGGDDGVNPPLSHSPVWSLQLRPAGQLGSAGSLLHTHAPEIWLHTGVDGSTTIGLAGSGSRPWQNSSPRYVPSMSAAVKHGSQFPSVISGSQ